MRYRCLCYDFWQHALVIVQRLPLQAAPHRGLGCWQVLPAAEVCGEDSYLPFTTYEEARSSFLICMHSPWQHWKENVHIPRKCLFLFSFDNASPTRVDEMLFSKAWCEWCLTHTHVKWLPTLYRHGYHNLWLAPLHTFGNLVPGSIVYLYTNVALVQYQILTCLG